MLPITVSVRGEQYELIKFTAPLPMPGPACCDPLPQDKIERERKNTEQFQQQRDERIHAKKECAQGVIDKLTVTCEDALNAIDKTVTSAINAATETIQTQNEDHSFGRLRLNFPELITERLIGDYRCKLCTRNGVLPGFLQVTGQHVLFIPEDGTPFAVTVCSILCLQPIKLAQNPATPPLFHSVDVVPINEAEGFQLFLTSGQLLIFKEFLSFRSLTTNVVREAITCVDHVWRAGAPVPNPNWKFTECSKFVQPDITVYPLKPKTAPDASTSDTAILDSRLASQQQQRPLNALETHS